MSNKVERLAALIDDKTMITTLIREGSDRVRLSEFKDARADIWHYFRLVTLDGRSMPYAVCIRCMKPVSYKAREGTGGLHRHPCSKMSAQAALAAGIPIRKYKGRIQLFNHPCQPFTTSDGTTQIMLAPALPAPQGAKRGKGSRSKKKVITTVSTTLPYITEIQCNPSIEMLVSEQCFDPINEKEYHKKVANLLCDLLVPIDQINEDSLGNCFITLNYNQTHNHFHQQTAPTNIQTQGTQQQLQAQTQQRYRINKVELISAIQTLYETARNELINLLKRQAHVTFVIDLWSEEITERQYMTIWTVFNHFDQEWRQILTTKEITFAPTKDYIIQRVDAIRQEVYGSVNSYVYIIDNNLKEFIEHFDENHLLCVGHQLYDIIKSAFQGNHIITEQINTVLKLCAVRPDLKISSTINELIHQNSCWSTLEIIKAINENYMEIEIALAGKEILIDRRSFNDIARFFSLLSSAIETLNAKNLGSTLTLVGLWRAKLEENCKLDDAMDSPLLKSVKICVTRALKKSQLHHPLFLMSVCLDPRFKKLKMLSYEMREETYSYLRNAVSIQLDTTAIPQPQPQQPPPPPPPPPPHQTTQQQQQQQQSHEFSCTKFRPEMMETGNNYCDDLMGPQTTITTYKINDTLPKTFNDYMDQTDDRGKDEIEIYLNIDPGTLQPLEFWNSDCGHRLPRLRLIALRLLSVPAVPHYCQISPQGQDFCIRRKGMRGHLADEMLFLHIFNKRMHNLQ